MPKTKTYLTITDFWGKGSDFNTEIFSWSRELPSPNIIGDLLSKVTVVRNNDKHSNRLLTLSVLNRKGMTEIFPQATITVNFIYDTGSRQRGTSLDFFNVSVVGYWVTGSVSDDSLTEAILLEYETMSMFDVSVELVR